MAENNLRVGESERAVLVGLCADVLDRKDCSSEESLRELEALLETAGGIATATVLQNKATPDPRTFIGQGKVQEVKEIAIANECQLVVFDNDLSPSQQCALEEDLGVRVLDRSGLILDIFASRAQTSEGRLQVELAQYKYLMPRLTGMWTHLVRQTAAGGSSPIGTRGPGETQLETDRRHIRRKIDKLEEDLEQVRRVRSTQRRLREKNKMPVVALVGYTNAGKSTLLNRLTDAGIPARNRLFDTLDTTTRRLTISPTTEVLLSDTVGFIRKLPHHLVDAFRATLEELQYADVLVHVIDASNPEWREQAEVVDGLISQLGALDTPRLEVFNKTDLVPDDVLPRGEGVVRVSAVTGEGIPELISAIETLLNRGQREVTLLLPYDKGGVLDLLHREADVRNVEYGQDGMTVTAVVRPDTLGKVSGYIAEE